MEGTLDLGAGLYVQRVILAVSLVAVAFFSSAEASLISVNKFRMRHLAEQGNRAALAVLRDHLLGLAPAAEKSAAAGPKEE